MKKVFFLLMSVLLSTVIQAQDFPPSMKLRLDLNDHGAYLCKLQSRPINDGYWESSIDGICVVLREPKSPMSGTDANFVEADLEIIFQGSRYECTIKATDMALGISIKGFCKVRTVADPIVKPFAHVIVDFRRFSGPVYECPLYFDGLSEGELGLKGTCKKI